MCTWIGLIFGARYKSAAVVSDGTVEQTEDQVDQYVPSAAPGCRAPHVWLSKAGQRLSTLDLLGRDFVLLTAPQGSAWREAAARVQAPRIVSIVIGDDIQDQDANWLDVYGLYEDGAVLVRPDGHVAWRSRSGVADPSVAFGVAVDAILCRAESGSAS